MFLNMPLLVLRRLSPTNYGTFGELLLRRDQFCGEVHICYTLEPKIPIINEDEHSLLLSYSPKFGRILPEIVQQGHQGLRIHSGNTMYDTSGCVLLGLDKDFTSLYYSREVTDMVKQLIEKRKITKIIIKNGKN